MCFMEGWSLLGEVHNLLFSGRVEILASQLHCSGGGGIYYRTGIPAKSCSFFQKTGYLSGSLGVIIGKGNRSQFFQEKAVLYYWQGATPVALFRKRVVSMDRDSPNIFPMEVND